MANGSRQHVRDNRQKLRQLLEEFVHLNRTVLSQKISFYELYKATCNPIKIKKSKCYRCVSVVYIISFITVLLCVALTTFLTNCKILDGLVEHTLGVRCVIPNNYFIWEATRPVSNCQMCYNLSEVLILYNASRDEFADFAYSSQPIVIRQSSSHWPAVQELNFKFLKTLFEDIEGSFESIEDDCQLLTFKTEFLGLRDVFNMSEGRLNGKSGTKPWYVGWSVCHPEMLQRMRNLYPRPHFLPEDAEHSHIDYIFMGYQQGAVMHLDYISRLMWQAQLVGRKKWQLMPPPECDDVCSPLSVTVEQGDIILLDTRQWYHDTHVDSGVFSLTVSSEYG